MIKVVQNKNSDLKGFCVGRMVWLKSHYLPITCSSLVFMPTSDFSHTNVGFSVLSVNLRKNAPIFT